MSRPPPAPASADAVLTAGVRHALVAEPTLRAGRNIHILAIGGIVRLSGVVDSGELLVNAARAASLVPGVAIVENRLVVRPRERPG